MGQQTRDKNKTRLSCSALESRTSVHHLEAIIAVLLPTAHTLLLYSFPAAPYGRAHLSAPSLSPPCSFAPRPATRVLPSPSRAQAHQSPLLIFSPALLQFRIWSSNRLKASLASRTPAGWRLQHHNEIRYTAPTDHDTGDVKRIKTDKAKSRALDSADAPAAGRSADDDSTERDDAAAPSDGATAALTGKGKRPLSPVASDDGDFKRSKSGKGKARARDEDSYEPDGDHNSGDDDDEDDVAPDEVLDDDLWDESADGSDIDLAEVIDNLDDEGLDDEELIDVESDPSQPLTFPQAELRYGEIRIAIAPDAIVPGSRTVGGNRAYPPLRARTIPVLAAPEPVIETQARGPPPGSPTPVDDACAKFDSMVRFIRHAKGVPDPIKAVLQAPTCSDPPTPKQLAQALTDDGRRLLTLAQSGDPILASAFDNNEAHEYAGSGVYAKLLFKDGTLIGAYVGLAIITFHRVLAHELAQLYAEQLPPELQRDSLQPQHVHRVAAANDIQIVHALVAKVSPVHLAYLESFFVTILGTYRHPAWLAVRTKFFPFPPLSFGLNLTSGGEHIRSIDPIRSRQGYGRVMAKLRKAVSRIQRPELLEAHALTTQLCSNTSSQFSLSVNPFPRLSSFRIEMGARTPPNSWSLSAWGRFS
ncbi:hypothetical protein V8E36_003540 [Tilletia maclaganii]